MQSGTAKTHFWVMEGEMQTPRTPDSLMGWSSCGDTSAQVKLRFETLDAAKAHAEKNGWDYTVSLAHDKRVKPRNYGDNFKYRPAEEGAAR